MELTLSQKSRPREEHLEREPVERFLQEAWGRREVLFSLIERVELTKDREILLYLRFSPPA